jgi:saccharopine dehydrogenase-like NADP-dependent oxidoreductase
MQKTITVLGAGLVGSAIIQDLAADGNLLVHAVDRSETALRKLDRLAGVRTTATDITKPGALDEAVKGSDLVVNAVPGFMGYDTLDRLIGYGKPIVDISFFPEDAFALDEKARKAGVTAIVDCGVAPGLCNMQAGHAEQSFDSMERYLCYVGGLPVERRWPYEYKAVFSPIDVIEEYTRPARYVQHGKVVVREALTDIELVDLPGVGTLEAFNTDGLRSLMRTMRAPDMKEKTLRHPGHAALMRVFRDSGFLSTEPLEVDGVSVRPIDLTTKLLFDSWKLQPGEQDYTVMRVEVDGLRDGACYRRTYDLLDRYDPESGVHSMARTTGYTCTATVHLVLQGAYTEPGISPPEFIGRTGDCYSRVTAYLQDRGIVVRETEGVRGDDGVCP